MTDFTWLTIMFLGVIACELGFLLLLFGVLLYELLGPKKIPDIPLIIGGLPPGMSPGIAKPKEDTNGDKEPNHGQYI